MTGLCPVILAAISVLFMLALQCVSASCVQYIVPVGGLYSSPKLPHLMPPRPILPRPSVAVVSTAETTLDLMCSLYESSSTDMQRKEVFAAALQDNWSTFYGESTSHPHSQRVH